MNLVLEIDGTGYSLEDGLKDYGSVVVRRLVDGSFHLKGSRDVVILNGKEHDEIELKPGLQFSVGSTRCRCYREEKRKFVLKSTTDEEDRALIEALKLMNSE